MTGRAASGGDFDELEFRRRDEIVHLAADLKNAFDGFFDVLQGFVFGIALRDTAGQRGGIRLRYCCDTRRDPR